MTNEIPRVTLKVGKQIELVFFLAGNRLSIFVRWEAAENIQKVTVSRLVTLRRFTPAVTEEIVYTMLKRAGYNPGKLGGRHFYEPGKGIAIGQTRGLNGGVTLSLFREKSFDFDRLRLRLKASQVAEVCRGIAPALGWELTE